MPDRPSFSKHAYQHGYEKGEPSAETFAPIPKDVAERIGTRYGDYSRLHGLVLSVLVWYARRSLKGGEIQYRGAGDVPVPEGVFVLSMQTVAENVYAYLFSTTGRRHIEDELGNMRPSFRAFYDKITNCFRWLEKYSYVEKLTYVEGDAMKGTYWTFVGTHLDAYVRSGEGEAVDVRERTRQVFIELDAARFAYGEACVSKYQRGRYLPHHAWNQAIATEGSNQDRHVSIGAFEAGVEVSEASRTAIPYVVLEPEEGDLVDRHETTRHILEGLFVDGADLSEIVVSYSGNQSFHVRIPFGMFGRRAFRTVDVARRTISRWAENSVGERLDVNLFDARHLIRMIGSRHERTGRFVTGFSADEFMGLTLAEIVGRSEQHEPFPMKDPFAAAPCDELVLQMADAADSLFRFYVPAFEDVDERPSSGAVRRALEGVAEGEAWHAKHVGRNKAAFVVACHFAKERGDAAWSALCDWNALNDPPLPERDLRQCLRSASRTISRTQNRANLQNV